MKEKKLSDSTDHCKIENSIKIQNYKLLFKLQFINEVDHQIIGEYAQFVA
jgi:hypothetical protein